MTLTGSYDPSEPIAEILIGWLWDDNSPLEETDGDDVNISVSRRRMASVLASS